MKFRKKPVEIEAVQLNWKNWNAVCELASGKELVAEYSDEFSGTCGEAGQYIQCRIPTLEGVMLAKHGDWIIKGVNGEIYPCKPDIFAKTYEQIN